MTEDSKCDLCEEYRALHRAYNALEAAQRAGARNGPEVVRLTDECSAKGIILVPGGEYRPNPKCEKHGEWTPAQMSALAHCFDVLKETLPLVPVEKKLEALFRLAATRTK